MKKIFVAFMVAFSLTLSLGAFAAEFAPAPVPGIYYDAESIPVNDVQYVEDATGNYLLALMGIGVNPGEDKLVRLDVIGGTREEPVFAEPVPIIEGLNFPHSLCLDYSDSDQVIYIADSKNNRVLGCNYMGEIIWNSQDFLLGLVYPNYTKTEARTNELIIGTTKDFLRVNLLTGEILERTPEFLYNRLHGTGLTRDGVVCFESNTAEIWDLRWDGSMRTTSRFNFLDTPRYGRIDRKTNSILISHKNGMGEWRKNGELLHHFPDPPRDIGGYNFIICDENSFFANMIILACGPGLMGIDRDSFKLLWEYRFPRSFLPSLPDEIEGVEFLRSMGYLR